MRYRALSLAIGFMVVGVAGAIAAPKPAAKPKVPAKPPVKGTKQFSGDQAVPGQEYTLGKESPMNFQLDRAEYSTNRVRVGESVNYPTNQEKYLVLHFTLHNPQKAEALVRFDTFEFTAVDSTNTNREGSREWGLESNQEALGMTLKPGQKVSGYTYIAVPAKGTVPKLVVKSNDNLVLRYDLKGIIKPLAGPTADPADKTGATALADVPAQIGTMYQMGSWDVTLTGITYSSSPINGEAPEEGGRYLIASLTVRNQLQREDPLRFDTFWLKSTDQDGADIDWPQNLIRASSDEDFGANVGMGKEVRVRRFVPIPKGLTATNVSITTGENPRSFVYDLSAVK